MWRERERERDARLGLCAGEGQGDGLLVGREMMRWGRCENMYRGWRVDKERRTHLCVRERVEVRVRTHSDSIETKCEMVSLSLSLSEPELFLITSHAGELERQMRGLCFLLKNEREKRVFFLPRSGLAGRKKVDLALGQARTPDPPKKH